MTSLGRFAFAIPALAHEAQAVNEIKRKQCFTVVMGNPPYSAASHNPSVDAEGDLTHIGTLMRRYFEIEGVPLGEKNPRWLQDDYVKFLRLAESQIERSAIGIVGMITNHGYLTNPTFRGMRYSLLKTFTSAALLDLHGNSKRGEVSPDGTVDENVFDIQQGVAISVWSRRSMAIPDLSYGKIERADLWGTRQKKYNDLAASKAGTLHLRLIHPIDPFYLFLDQDVDLRREYDAFWPLKQVFPVSNTGVITKRDDLTIGWTRDDVWRTVSRFVTLNAREARDEFGLPADVRDWKVEWAQKDLRTTGLDRGRIQPITYRPFDTRFIYYTGNARGFVGWPVEKVMRHLLVGDNYGLISARSNKSEQMDHFFVTRYIMETKCGERTTQSCVFPLFLVTERDLSQSRQGRHPNIQSRFVKELGERIGAEYLSKNNPAMNEAAAEDLLFYSYAVFFSPSYRKRYAEFLKIDFPRLPLPGGLGLFRDLVRLGGELVALHVLESPKLAQPIAEFIGGRHPEVEKISWSRTTAWIDKAQTTGFKGVCEDVWDYHVGGYQVCEKWLKDRKGRTLSKDDIAHYQKIVVALSETIRLTKEIDEVIAQHGGWPNAFQTGQAKAAIAKVIAFRPRSVQPEPGKRYVNCVPLVPLKAAAGAFGDPQHIEDDGFEWVAVESRHRLRPGMFVAQVVGKSMEPAIPDGSYCLFRAPVEGTRQGKTVLVQLRDSIDAETSQRYTVKRYESEKSHQGELWQHERITLKPLNPDFEPIILSGIEEGDLQVIAELVDVLGGEA